MNRLKRIIMSTIATLAFITPLASPALVSAQDIDSNLSCGANLNFSGDGDCETDEAGKTAGDRVDNVVTQVINIVSLLVGVAAVIMIMVGGLRYVTSNGDSGQVGNAKNTILYAVVGLVVVALAQIIVRFVVSKAVTPEE
jgi:hypothetical protein